MASLRTHYETLEVESSATDAEIREAYRLLATMLHPDKFPSGSKQQEMATRKMQAVNDAWAALKEPTKRSAYDASLRQGAVADGLDSEDEYALQTTRRSGTRCLRPTRRAGISGGSASSAASSCVSWTDFEKARST